MTTSNNTGPAKPMWVNPLRHDDPHDTVLVEYTQMQASVIAAALRQAAESAATAGEAKLLRTR